MLAPFRLELAYHNLESFLEFIRLTKVVMNCFF